MAFDFEKEYREFHMPKNRPETVNAPEANCIAARGTDKPAGQSALRVTIPIFICHERKNT